MANGSDRSRRFRNNPSWPYPRSISYVYHYPQHTFLSERAYDRSTHLQNEPMDVEMERVYEIGGNQGSMNQLPNVTQNFNSISRSYNLPQCQNQTFTTASNSNPFHHRNSTIRPSKPEMRIVQYNEACKLHCHWKVSCEMNGENFCYECLSPLLEGQNGRIIAEFLSLNRDHIKKSCIAGYICNDGEQCPNHKHFKIFAKLSCGKFVCQVCLDDYKEHVEKCSECRYCKKQLNTASVKHLVDFMRKNRKTYYLYPKEAKIDIQCEKHKHWKICSEMPCGELICPLCLDEYKQNSDGNIQCKSCLQDIAPYSLDPLKKAVNQNRKTYYMCPNEVESSVQCEKHKHWKICSRTPCGELLCPMCVHQFESYVLKHRKCQFCPQDMTFSSILPLSKRVKENRQVHCIHPIVVESNLQCEKHKHWKICARMPCGQTVCPSCLFEYKTYSVGSTKCKSCLHEIEFSSLEAIRKTVYEKKQTYIINPQQVHDSTAMECEEHKHWKICIEFPCGQKLCPECILRGFLCGCQSKDDVASIVNKTFEINQQNLIRYAVNPEIADGHEMCRHHKQNKVYWKWPCNWKMCFLCLDEFRSKIWNLDDKFTSCKHCKGHISTQVVLDQFEMIDRHPQSKIQCLIPTEMRRQCTEHKHWKICLKMECGKEMCLECIHMLQSETVVECQVCKQHLFKSTFSQIVEELEEKMESDVVPFEKVESGPCSRHKHWKGCFSMPCGGQMCILCFEDLKLFSFVHKTKAAYFSCPFCEQSLPKAYFFRLLFEIDENRLDSLFSSVKLIESNKECKNHKFWKQCIELPCGKIVCFQCLKTKIKSEVTVKTLQKDIECIRCCDCNGPKPFVPTAFLHETNMEELTFHVPEQVDSTQMCRKHNSKVCCLFPCGAHFCSDCLGEPVKRQIASDDSYRCPMCHGKFPISTLTGFHMQLKKQESGSEECKAIVKPTASASGVGESNEELEKPYTQESTAKQHCLQEKEANKFKQPYNIDQSNDGKKKLELEKINTQEGAAKKLELEKNNTLESAAKEKEADKFKRPCNIDQINDEKKELELEKTKTQESVAKDRHGNSDRQFRYQCGNIEFEHETFVELFRLKCRHYICTICIFECYCDNVVTCQFPGCQILSQQQDIIPDPGFGIAPTSAATPSATDGQHTETQAGNESGQRDIKDESNDTYSHPGVTVNSTVEATSVITGLENIGASCYANSILQVLGQTPVFVTKLKQTTANKSKDMTASVLLQILTNMNKHNWHRRTECLYDLMNRIFQRDRSFRQFQQNDCHSFLMSLFNLIDEEYDREGTSDAEGKPVHVFHGYMQNIFTCKPCNHTDASVEKQVFSSLLIPIGTGILYTFKTWKLEDGIQILTQKEKFGQNVLPCRMCEDPTKETIKELMITEAPKVLVLQLARFVEKRVSWSDTVFLEKSDCPVEYKPELMLDCLDENRKKVKKRYLLYGVVLHRGTLEGGHYCSFVKSEKNGWHYCSDRYVKQAKQHEVFGWRENKENAYLLFYNLADNENQQE